MLGRPNRNHLEMIWHDGGQALRRGEDFAQFVRDAELPAYWELFGWPDACRPDDELEFVCE